jgi:uncharacterized protein (TIGR02246 family)
MKVLHPTPADEAAVTSLYRGLLDAWNRRSASDYAALFEEEGSVVGFDGSMMNGRGEIVAELNRIFADHVTAAYVGKIRSLRFPATGLAILGAVAGLVPPGKTDINPAANSVQTLVAVRRPDGWRIAHFHNTPAQFHDRPDLSAALTEELRGLLKR